MLAKPFLLPSLFFFGNRGSIFLQLYCTILCMLYIATASYTHVLTSDDIPMTEKFTDFRSGEDVVVISVADLRAGNKQSAMNYHPPGQAGGR
jgi:hypothetical protein